MIIKKPKMLIFLTTTKGQEFSNISTPEELDEALYDGWHSRIARNMVKYHPEFKYTIIRTVPERFYYQLDGLHERNISGIHYKLVKEFGPLCRIYIPNVVKEIKKLKEKYRVVIHLFQPHSFSSYHICLSLRHTPIITMHVGGECAYHSDLSYSGDTAYKTRRKNKFFAYLKFVLERMSLRYSDFFNSVTKYETLYLSLILRRIIPFEPPIGIDFDTFKPTNKLAAKTKLGINPNKKVISNVGPITRSKGADLALEAFKKLKNESSFY